MMEEARNSQRSKNILMEESKEYQTRAESLAEKLIAGKLNTNQVPPRVRWEVLQILNKRIMGDNIEQGNI